MSIPQEETDSGGGTGHKRFVMALRLVATLSACVAIAALWSVERTEVAHDLQLAAEAKARPGETLALRALLFRDVDAPEGPTLAVSSVRVRLLDRDGVELGATRLTPTALDTMDGAIALPATLTGRFELEAITEYEGHTLRCRRTLMLDEHAAPGVPHGREAAPLQQFALGRVRASGTAAPPEPLLVRVVGGACVPEQRCRLLTWVGEPAAALAVRPGDAVSLVGPPEPAGETAGIVALELVTHGPDAQLTLEARRADQLVGERSLRLPVALGEVGIYAPASIVAPTALALRFALPPGRAHAIADVFGEGRWRASRVIADAGSGVHALEAALLPHGLARIEARVDRFASDGSGARVLYVRSPGEDDRGALVRLARELARHDPGEPTAAWAHALPPFAYDDPQRAAAFLLAALEERRLAVPPLASGRPAALRVLARTKVKLRFGVASALVLSALVIGMSIARRGLSASDEAQAILDEARGPEGHVPPGERFRERARVLLLVLAVASAFLAGALLIAAKPLWF